MARHLFGGGVADWTFRAIDDVAGIDQLAQMAGGETVTFWNSQFDGEQYTDLLDADEQPISSVVSSSGGDGRAVGQIPPLYGPAGVTQMWAQAGDGPRALIIPTDTASALAAHMADTTVHRGGGGDSSVTGGPGVLYVVAAGSPQRELDRADYICDGSDCNEQIQAAIDRLRAGRGGTVLLGAGVYYLSAPLDLYGHDDVGHEQEIYLRGTGPSNTELVAADGLPAAIRLSHALRAHISDLGIHVGGATSGIVATGSPELAAEHKSAWFSSIERVQVVGPADGSHTGWAFDLDNLSRSAIRNIEIAGVGNGLRLHNSTDFGSGDVAVSRVGVSVIGYKATAFALYTTAGPLHNVVFDSCHAVGSGTLTTCWDIDGWELNGSAATSHIRMIGCEAEGFTVALLTNSGARDVVADFTHVRLGNDTTFARLYGEATRVSAGTVHVEVDATARLIDDWNPPERPMNVLGPVHLVAEAGSYISANLGWNGAARDVTTEGPGVVSLDFARPHLRYDRAGEPIAATLARETLASRGYIKDLTEMPTIQATPQLAVDRAALLLCTWYTGWDVAPYTPPAGMTAGTQTDGMSSMIAAWETMSAAGTVPSRVARYSGWVDYWFAISILAPTVSATPPTVAQALHGRAAAAPVALTLGSATPSNATLVAVQAWDWDPDDQMPSEPTGGPGLGKWWLLLDTGPSRDRGRIKVWRGRAATAGAQSVAFPAFGTNVDDNHARLWVLSGDNTELFASYARS